jgi:hypothetical protein
MRIVHVHHAIVIAAEIVAVIVMVVAETAADAAEIVVETAVVAVVMAAAVAEIGIADHATTEARVTTTTLRVMMHHVRNVHRATSQRVAVTTSSSADPRSSTS